MNNIELEQAIDVILSSVNIIAETEEIFIMDGMGRICAQNIFSQIDSPTFNRCALREYAKRKKRRKAMNLSLQLNCADIDWNNVSSILKRVGMGCFESEVHKKAFENSHCVVFVYDGDQLVGFGRAISDGIREAALYDIAVVPEYQGKGVGRSIMKSILDRLSHCNIILFASPGKEPFYQKLNFRKMKTGMALFVRSERMQEAGFIE